MSNHAWYRALQLHIIQQEEMRQKDFREALHMYLGVVGGYPSEFKIDRCDEMTKDMSDAQFKDLVEAVKRRMKKRSVTETYVAQERILTTPAGVM